MTIHIIRQPAREKEISEMLKELETYIKLAVDVDREILAGGGEGKAGGDVGENRHFTLGENCDKSWVRHDKRDWMHPEFFITQWCVGLKGIGYSARGR